MSEAKVRVRVAHNAMHLPVVALRGLVVFPNNVVHFEVGRQKSIAAIEAAMHANSNIFLIAQKDMETEEPTAQDLYAYGVISEIKQVLRVSEDLVKVLVEGKSRAKLLDLDASGKYLQADVRPAPVRGVAPDKRTQTEALVRSLKECFEEYLSYSPQISKDVVYNIVSSDNPLYLSEYMPANLLLKYEDKQTILQENSIPSRLEKLLLVMRQECEVLAIEKELDDKVNVQMDKNQRDYYLREQMHIISEELGDAEDTRAEAEKYAQKIQDLHLDAASEEKLLKECERLGKMAGNQAEISVIRSYLDTVIGLPWHTFTKDDLNQTHARKVLDRTRDAAADKERRTDGDARLADLTLMFAVAKVAGRTARADGAADRIGEREELLEVLLRADARAACDDDARALEVDGGVLADDLHDLDRDLDAGEVRVVLHELARASGLGIERLHHTLADGRHLRPVARVDDRRDDVAAERGTDLLEDVLELLARLLIGEVVDLQVGAVGREAAAERGGDRRSEVAAHVRRAEDHDLRLALLDELDERVAVGLAAEHLELLVLDEVHRVRTRLEERLRETLDAIAHEHRAELDAELVGEFASLAEEFPRNVAQLALFLFGENPNFALATIKCHKNLLSRWYGPRRVPQRGRSRPRRPASLP